MKTPAPAAGLVLTVPDPGSVEYHMVYSDCVNTVLIDMRKLLYPLAGCQRLQLSLQTFAPHLLKSTMSFTAYC